MSTSFVCLANDFFSYFLHLKGFYWFLSIEWGECGPVWTALIIFNKSTLTYLFINLVSFNLVKSAKHRSWNVVLGIPKIFLHFIPFFYQATSDSASNMIAASTAFKITLNATALVLMTSEAVKLKAWLWHFSRNHRLWVVREPNFRNPVNTDYMSPFSFLIVSWFHDAVNVWTICTFYFSAF